jgi:hypothetical protein
MLAHSFYESDNHAIRYVEALAQQGDSVKVIPLQREVLLIPAAE